MARLPSWHRNARPAAAPPVDLHETPLASLERFHTLGARTIALGFKSKEPHAAHYDAKGEDPRAVAAHVTAGRGNYAVLTGRGLAVLDVDAKNGGVESLARLEADQGVDLSGHPTVWSGSGGGSRHVYMSTPVGRRFRTTLRDYPGLEFRAGGSRDTLYIVGPGSVHPSGRRYQWDPASLDRILTAELVGDPWLPTAPDAVLALYDRGRRKCSASTEPREPEPIERLRAVLFGCGVECVGIAVVGCGYDRWVQVGMALHQASRDNPEALALWIDWGLSDPKYARGAPCEVKWDSFTLDTPGGVDMGSLQEWHREANGHAVAAFAGDPLEDFADEPLEPEAPFAPHEITLSGRQRDAIAADVVAAVAAWNVPPRLFRRAGRVVLAHVDEKGAPALREQTSARFLDVTAQAARFYTRQRTDEGWKKVHSKLPQAEAGVALERLAVGEALPPLRGVADAPVMRPDGSILDQVGYDPATGLYAAFEPVALEVPERPAQVAAARDLLLELVRDFPFVDEGSRANALAAVLTLPLRPLFPLAPLFAIDAPMPGTGKSLLARLVAIVAQGREPHAIPEPDDPEEARKVLTSLIREGAGLVWIDNVERPLKGGALCAVLTSTTWRDRVLGVSETAKLEHALTAVCTGNNLQVLGDLVRRTVWSRLDAQVPNPEERSSFAHPLPDWAFAERPRLLSAVFTLARAWIAAGRPAPTGVSTMAGFEGWQRVVGGTLEVAGVPGFLANRAEQRAALDDAVPAWAAFLAAWAKALPGPVSAKRLAQAAAADSALCEVVPDELGDPTDRGFTTRLGHALRKRAGQRLAFGRGVAWVEKIQGASHEGGGAAALWRARVQV